ncbi:hypothetical protein BGZ73_002004 [Actinomortierella ambigua]|nr:hypothetical protein BGZ73_002004 [Actinomortierella ambigua]
MPKEKTVELHVNNLSLSLVPVPGIVPSTLQLIYKKTKSLFSRQPNSSPDTTYLHKQDVSNIGLNVFRSISMNVRPGQGTGKTTLLKALAGQLSSKGVVTSGSITFNNEPPNGYWESSRVGYLHQEDQLHPFLTPRETLAFVAKIRDGTTSLCPAMQSTIDRLLTSLGLSECADRRVGDMTDVGSGGRSARSRFSGGERRRLSVAIQLLNDPTLLFCDEPTSGNLVGHLMEVDIVARTEVPI